jgi:hypothetical protein
MINMSKTALITGGKEASSYVVSLADEKYQPVAYWGGKCSANFSSTVGSPSGLDSTASLLPM